jgi:hypothetical protein
MKQSASYPIPSFVIDDDDDKEMGLTTTTTISLMLHSTYFAKAAAGSDCVTYTFSLISHLTLRGRRRD